MATPAIIAIGGLHQITDMVSHLIAGGSGGAGLLVTGGIVCTNNGPAVATQAPPVWSGVSAQGLCLASARARRPGCR